MASDKTQDEIIEELIEYNEYLVPVIGDELFYVGDKNSSLHDSIVNYFESKYPDVAKNLSDETRNIIREGGYDGLTLLARHYNIDDQYESLYIEYIKKNRARIKLNNTIKEYLEKTKPNLIITTSPFSLLEEEIGYCKNSIWYKTDEENKTQYKKQLPTDSTIYHLFGNAESPLPDWVYNDVSLLRFIHNLHENDSAPEGLTNHLKKKLLFILGCKLPNWFFQFILYPINRDLILYKRGRRQGFWLKENNEENIALKSFLEGINFLPQKDMELIIGKVNERLKNQPKLDDEKDKDYDIFISYAGEDNELAIKIAEHLSSSKYGLRVWLDRNGGYGEVEKGGDYWKRIENGIRHSRYFMPIVTSNYLNKWLLYKLSQNEYGLIKETNIALDWYQNDENPYKGCDVYSLPVVIKAEFLNNGIGIYPDEFFKDKECYYYTGDNNDTFSSHPWGKYKK